MYQILKLEAVNRLIQPINGQIVSDLTQANNDTVIQAVRALDVATDKVQLNNEWNFNYDGPLTLVSDGNGEILIPADFLTIKFRSWDKGSIWNLSTVDAKVYDLSNSTSQVAGSVVIEGTRKYSYDDCPGAIQNLIIETAKLEFLSQFAKASPNRLALYTKAESDAFRAAQKYDSGLRWNTLDRGPSLRNTPGINSGVRGWWNGF